MQEPRSPSNTDRKGVFFFPLRQQRLKNSSFSKCKCINQSFNNVLERVWLLPARLEHQCDSVRVVPVIGQYSRTVKGTVNTSYPCNWTERVMCVRCCLAFRRVNCCFFFMKTYNRCLVSFSNFVIVLINW